MHSEESLEMFSEFFAEYRQASTPLLDHIDNVAEQLGYVENISRECGTGYCFQMIPCFTPFITTSHMEKYISRDIPCRPQFIEQFQEYTKKMTAWYEQGLVVCIFSLDGVLRFLESGKIDEYPEKVCMPFDKYDRIYLVKKLIQSCRSKHYRMLKKDIGNPECGLYMFVNRQNGYLMFSSPYDGHPVFLNIDEPGLLFTFYDFCENLEDDMFYTYEENMELLEQLISK